MRAVISERQLRKAIKTILLEKIRLDEQNEQDFSFPSQQYNSIITELDRQGIEKNKAMIALAAIYLRDGNDDQFVRSLLASHNIIYNPWHNSVLLPFLETQGQKAIPKQDLAGESFGADNVSKMTEVLNGLGKSNLVPLLKKLVADWGKRIFKYPKYDSETMNNIADYALRAAGGGTLSSQGVSNAPGKEKKDKDVESTTSGVKSDVTSTAIITGNKAIDLLGKKFSYEDKGEPQGVIVAKAPNGTLIGAVYSKASEKDPIFAKLGRFISEEEAALYPDWLWPDWVLEQTHIKDKMDKIYNSSVAKGKPQYFGNLAYNVSQKGGRRGKLFVPFNPQRPKFDSTLAAQIAASEGRCSIEFSKFRSEVRRLNQLKGEDRDYQIARIANCIKSWTTDSIKYAIISSVVSWIVGAIVAAISGPAGAATGPIATTATEILTELVPGFLVAGLYTSVGMKESAARQIIVTIINCLTPAAIQALGLTSWKQFFANVITSVTLSWISKKITQAMFGNDYGLEESDYDDFINSQGDSSLEDFKSKHKEDLKQIRGAEEYLRKIYPNI